MNDWENGVDSARMCLHHSQSDIESSLAEIEVSLARWELHYGNPSLRIRILEQLTNARWLLTKHFERMVGEGYLERIVDRQPELYDRLREVEDLQWSLTQRFSQWIASIQSMTVSPERIASAIDQFRAFREEVRLEEYKERELLEN